MFHVFHFHDANMCSLISLLSINGQGRGRGNFGEHPPYFFWPKLLCGAWTRGGIHDIEMKFGWVIENYKLINLVQFNWQMTSSLRHNDVIAVEILDFYEILPIKIRKA